MSASYKRMRALGWSHEEASWRSKVIDGNKAAATSLVKTWGLKDGDSIAVEYSNPVGCPRPDVAVCSDGRLSVGGCIPSPRMIGKRLSKPFAHTEGGFGGLGANEVAAVLADGTEVKRFQRPGEGTVRYAANGKEYRCIMDAAIDITPA